MAHQQYSQMTFYHHNCLVPTLNLHISPLPPVPSINLTPVFISSFFSHALLYMQKGFGCFMLREMWLGRVGLGKQNPGWAVELMRHQVRYRGRVTKRGRGSHRLLSKCLDSGINIQTQDCLRVGVRPRGICFSELLLLMLNYYSNIYSNAFHFSALERNDC